MKCKLIFFNSFDGEKFELNSDLSPDQSDNIDEVIKYIFYNYKKEFNQYIKGLKSLNRHSISRNNVKSDLFSCQYKYKRCNIKL